MKSGGAFVLFVGLWFCLSPFLDGDDGTLPLPHNGQTTTQDSEQQTDDLWSLFCR